MRLRTSEIAVAVGGRLVGPDREVDGATQDSRAIQPGELFVPIVAERDGHEFVGSAVAAGAGAYLTARPADPAVEVPAVEVPDTAAALSRLGAHGRGRLGGPVVGITGSVGKTTTKDLTAGVVGRRFATHAAVRSFNNEIGVPLTILQAPEGTEVLVVEMGARGEGHIAALCEVARPTIGVVTTVEAVHTEHFGDLEGVARGKGELIAQLPPDGVAVLNGENPLVAAMATRTAARVVRFGASGHLAAEHVVVDADLRPRFLLVGDWGHADVHLGVRGRHNVANALAAAAVGLVVGVPLPEVAAGLADADGSPWRMALHRLASGALLLDDSYNAGPASMEAAVRSLASLDARRRIAVLGPMAELGPASAAAHAHIAEIVADLRIVLVAVGTPEYGAAAHVVDGAGGAVAALDRLGAPAAGDAILAKGSRVAGLDQVVAALLAADDRT
jgi:UDP-N-acetylmuramoyl-tripeptide--D-alanyl-D-alanine ligase